MCPHCGRDAPVVYRGAVPHCTACGKIRAPLAGPAVHLTGKPSRYGGVATRAVGWFTLILGLTVALAIGGFVQWLFPAAIVGWVLGIGFSVLTMMVAYVLLKGGSALRDSGARAEARTFEQAVFAVADSRGGILSTLDVAQVLGLSEGEADRLLTDFAKRNPERVRVEVDEHGTLVYQFPYLMIGTAKTLHGDTALDVAAIEEAAASSKATTRRGP